MQAAEKQMVRSTLLADMMFPAGVLWIAEPSRDRGGPVHSGDGKVWAQILASGPADERWRAIHTLLFAAIPLARERVWIVTPYFVPRSTYCNGLADGCIEGSGCPVTAACTFRPPTGAACRAFFPG